METKPPAEETTAQRRPVSQSVNFRDLGGIESSDGRKVKCGCVFRSGAPDYPLRAELEQGGSAVLRLICDLRSAAERATPIAPSLSEGVADYWTPNAEQPAADPIIALRSCTIDAATTRAVMHQVYEAIPFEQASAFRGLFRRLVDGDIPLMVHCASGKDRTGVFTALLLHGLGVARGAIEADYLRSNDALDAITVAFVSEPRHAPLVAAPPPVWAPLMRSELAYLDAAFGALEKRCGTVDRYLEDWLGVGPAEREALRSLLLEPA